MLPTVGYKKMKDGKIHVDVNDPLEDGLLRREDKTESILDAYRNPHTCPTCGAKQELIPWLGSWIWHCTNPECFSNLTTYNTSSNSGV